MVTLIYGELAHSTLAASVARKGGVYVQGGVTRGGTAPGASEALPKGPAPDAAVSEPTLSKAV
jgi:hypothetical protein